MRIEILGGGHTTIADDSPNALKIREGFDYEFKDGELVVKRTKSGKTKWAKANEAEDTSLLTLEKLGAIVAEYIRNCKCA